MRRLPAVLVNAAAGHLGFPQVSCDDVAAARMAAGHLRALGAVRAARRAGLRVPRDVSVIGYDDSALMNCTEPPLTTVRRPIEAMGRAAVDLLVAQIDAVAVPGDELLFEPELVVRASTAPAGRRPVPA
ncbi:substrate-binding domain-containing protein [Streptosporangium sp. NPDC003464]